MTYEKSQWFKGLLYAEQMSQQGWRVKEFDCLEQYFMWEYADTQGVHKAYGDNQWLDGVRDYHRNRNIQLNRLVEGK